MVVNKFSSWESFVKIKIEDYGMNGEGVGRNQGKIVLIPNALVNEIIECEEVEDYGNYSTAKIKQIVKDSENRTKEKCEFATVCGGCDLQHMCYAEQLKFKQILVKKTLKKIAKIDFNVSNTEASQQFKYRNKMSFSVKDGKIGFKCRCSNDVVDVDVCLLANQRINNILTQFKKCNLHQHKQIKNLVIRDINDQILIGVVASGEVDLNEFAERLNNLHFAFGLFQVLNTRKDSVVLDGKVGHICGIKEIKIKNFDLTYSVDLMGFHQTNIEIQNKIYEKVLSYISNNSTVVNGFSGQGLLSAIIATKAEHVIGIEINKYSHKSAEQLKQINKIQNLTNICGDFHKEIKNIKHADTIILDPSKKGCGNQVMNEIKHFTNIIYISCNPIALAKDLREIIEEYEIEEITPFDMFPNTVSVETVVKLKRKGE